MSKKKETQATPSLPVRRPPSGLVPMQRGELMKLSQLDNEVLVERYQQGQDLALYALVEKNERLVQSRAHRYYRPKSAAEFEDLVQSGMMGLIHAVGKFDVSRGFKFTTYAVPWIDKYMQTAVRNADETIRIPPKKMQRINFIRRYWEAHPEFTQDELLEGLLNEGFDKKELLDLIFIMQNQLQTASLNIRIGDGEDGAELMEFAENAEPSVEDQVLKASEAEMIQDLMSHLTEREQLVITKRFGLDGKKPETLEQVGQTLGVTRERVRQIEAQALKKMRQFSNPED